MLLAMPSGIQKCPPKSAPSASLPAGSAPIMLFALTAMYGSPEGCCPAMMVPYQWGCAWPEGPVAQLGRPGGHHLGDDRPGQADQQLHREDTGRADRGREVRAGQGPGDRLEADPPVHPAVGAGQVRGQRRRQRGQEGPHQSGVGHVDRAGLRVGAGVVDDQLVTALADGQLVAVQPRVAGVRRLRVQPVRPGAVRDLPEPVQEERLAGVDHPGHHRLDRVRAVAPDQRLDLAHGDRVRRNRRPQVHLHDAGEP